jgi:hypothetical protein
MKQTTILICLLLTGCATALTEKGKSVRLLMKTDAPANCTEITTVRVPGVFTIDETSRRNALREKAYEAGGNLVTYNHVNSNNTVTGTAFKCPR